MESLFGIILGDGYLANLAFAGVERDKDECDDQDREKAQQDNTGHAHIRKHVINRFSAEDDCALGVDAGKLREMRASFGPLCVPYPSLAAGHAGDTATGSWTTNRTSRCLILYVPAHFTCVST